MFGLGVFVEWKSNFSNFPFVLNFTIYDFVNGNDVSDNRIDHCVDTFIDVHSSYRCSKQFIIYERFRGMRFFTIC